MDRACPGQITHARNVHSSGHGKNAGIARIRAKLCFAAVKSLTTSDIPAAGETRTLGLTE